MPGSLVNASIVRPLTVTPVESEKSKKLPGVALVETFANQLAEARTIEVPMPRPTKLI